VLIEELAEVEAVVSVGGALRVTTDPLGAPAINQRLVEAGIAVSELGPDRASLEEVFLELTRYEREDE
jgi:hypothetical protein